MNTDILIPGDILDAIMKQYPLAPLANYDDAGDENYWVERERLAAEFGYRLAQPKQTDAVELIEWLKNECPPGTMTYDLSHDFAENLRNRLDKLSKP